MKLPALKNLNPYFTFLLVLFPFIFIAKGSIVLAINTLHNPLGDYFFARISYLGDGVFIPVLLLILLFGYKLKFTYQFVLSALLQIVIVLIFKELLFSNLERPYFFFKEIRDSINFVDGVKIRYVDSFPSGHTATVFFITSYLALVTKRKYLPVFLAALAITVGFSRMYLVQHFFVDVYFGMLFGILSSVAAYYLVKRYPKSWYNKRVIVNFPGSVASPVKRIMTNFNLW